MRQIVLILRYNGSNYHGWQIQSNAKTVQGTVQAAISQITQEDVHLIGCGRTDTGVHAHIYVASFLSASTIPTERIPVALNSLLPNDIAVLGALDAPLSFHPIRSCVKKEYTYTVYTHSVQDPFLQGRALHMTRKLNTQKIERAAAHFIGTHNFASMRSLGTEVSSTVRTVFNYDVISNDGIMQFIACADGFLYNMARTMAGTLLDVGFGKISPDEIPNILKSGDRSLAGPTAPACGLALTRLWYDDFEKLKEIAYVPGKKF